MVNLCEWVARNRRDSPPAGPRHLSNDQSDDGTAVSRGTLEQLLIAAAAHNEIEFPNQIPDVL